MTTKILFLCAAMISMAMARENPFFAIDTSLPVTSNIPDTLPKLTAASYNFPNQARVLKEVSFTIQNVDGSIETRTMQVDNAIDWHAPLVISQASRSVVGSSTRSTSAADFGFVRIETKEKRLTITSNDTMIRHFTLGNPNRIIIDYKHKEPFDVKEKILNAPPYKSVSVANHGQFVRVTVILDGRYDYTLKNNGKNVLIYCR